MLFRGPLPATRSHHFLLAASVLALLLPVVAAQARIRSYPPSVEIGMADAIAIGTALRFHAGEDDAAPSVRFAVEQLLRGSVRGKELRVSLPPHSELIEAENAPEAQRCAGPASADADAKRVLERVVVVGGSTQSIRCRARYVLYLGRDSVGRYRLQRAFPASEAGRLEALRELLPHVPAWGKARRGLATMLVTDTPLVASGDRIEVSFGLKNVGDAPLSLHLGGARDARSHFTLHIIGPDGRRVAAQPHPELDADSLTHFFRHMSAVGTLRLEPGESTFLPSDSINTAGGGWGYQEQLDFSYYPMPQRGRYRIVGTAQRFLPDAAPTTRPLEIRVD